MSDVTLHLYAGFRRHVGGRRAIHVAIEPGQTVRQLLEQFEVPVQDARIIFCDNRIAGLDHVLHGGETVGVFPAVGGG